MSATSAVRPSAALDGRAAIILVTCCMIWGVGLVMVKTANGGISPMLNAALRSIASTILLGVWARWRGVRFSIDDGTLGPGLLTGLFFALEFLTLYPALTLTQVARATIFLHCAPFVAAYGEHLLVPGHRLTRMKSTGLLAAFGGLAIALGGGVTGGVSTISLVGDLLALLGGIAWGLTTVTIRASPLRNAPAEKTLLYQLAVSIVPMLAASWLLGERGITMLSTPVLAAFAYTVFGTVVFGYTIWFWLMRSYAAATLHAFTFLTPIFGAFAGHILLGETVGWPTIVGLSLVAVGIWLVNRPGDVRLP